MYRVYLDMTAAFIQKAQFLRAVSHTHTPALLSNDHQNDSDCDDDEQPMPIIDDNSSTSEASQEQVQQPQQPAIPKSRLNNPGHPG